MKKEVSKAPESDLRYEVLKGTKTAVWCDNFKEYKQVSEIVGACEFDYDSLKPIICLDDKSKMSPFSSICKAYNIFPAPQFIAANSHESDKGEVKLYSESDLRKAISMAREKEWPSNVAPSSVNEQFARYKYPSVNNIIESLNLIPNHP